MRVGGSLDGAPRGARSRKTAISKTNDAPKQRDCLPRGSQPGPEPLQGVPGSFQGPSSVQARGEQGCGGAFRFSLFSRHLSLGNAAVVKFARTV